MSQDETRNQQTGITPQRQRQAKHLLDKVSALEKAGDNPIANIARKRLHAEARGMGMRVATLTLTRERIPDPHLEALPSADLQRLTAITRDLVQTLIGHGMDEEDFAKLIVLQARASGLELKSENVAVDDGLS